MAVLTRDQALINNPLLLYTTIYDGEALIDPFAVNRVEIWKGDFRKDEGTLIQTIYEDQIIDHTDGDSVTSTSTGVTRTSTGTFSYQTLPIADVYTYFDRLVYTPIEGADEEEIVSRTEVQAITGVSSLALGQCRLYGTITDSGNEPIEGVEVVVNKVNVTGLNQAGLVSFKPRYTTTKNNGEFSIPVATDCELSISVPSIGYRRIFVIPSGTKEKDLAELDSWLHPQRDNPGEENDYVQTTTGIVRPSSTGYGSSFENELNQPIFSWDRQPGNS